MKAPDRYPLLIVDDEPIMANALKDTLAERGYSVSCVTEPDEAIEYIQKKRPSIVLTDLKMPGMSGIELLEKAKALDPTIEVVVMTAYGTVQSAVDAMKKGAYDDIMKPFSIDEIVAVLERIFSKLDLESENIELRRELRERARLGNMIGKSEGMQRVYDLIMRVASSHANVLIRGESGTGKELVADAIHYASPRASKPFLKVNCAALPATLLESELFGHEKGAFTNAIARKAGRFELADGGTLFLDEIGDVPLELQVKLLRVLQERTFERVGGTETLKVDVRLIAATNQDLERLVAEKKFREDLYYRLNVIPIHLPPLRERREDIPLLVRHFLEKFCLKNGKSIKEFSRGAMEKLIYYSWPGNVRELENLIERLVVLSEGEIIDESMLPEQVRGVSLQKSGSLVPGALVSLEEVEKNHIAFVLREVDWNLSRAARILMIDRKTLYAKIEKYGLEEGRKGK